MGDDEENDEPDHETFVSQAMYELRSGSAEIALEYLNNALKLEQDDENIYIMRYPEDVTIVQSLTLPRAQCLVKLGRPSQAIQDSEVALKANRYNPKALLVKGEALYIDGEFEMGLVQLERGWKIRHDAALKVS